MSDELIDELGAINAIYPDSVHRVRDLTYNIEAPERLMLQVQIRFSKAYPDEVPDLLQVILLDLKRYPDTAYLKSHFTDLLGKIFSPGIVCIFDLQMEIQEYLEKYDAEHLASEDSTVGHSELGKEAPRNQELSPRNMEKQLGTLKVTDPLEGWIQSDPISDRGSTFVAFLRRVHSVEEAEEYLDALVTDRKVARSSHNMTAWRIKKDNGIQFQDCDDDGETAAGSRLLHLLTMMNVWNVMVVVSRWFGGAHIGSDRFKHINSAARDSIVKAGFICDSANATNPKKNRAK